MSDDKLAATTFKVQANDPATRDTGRSGKTRTDKQQASVATRRTVGVYDRPPARSRLSLSMIVILLLSALVSVAAAARFLF